VVLIVQGHETINFGDQLTGVQAREIKGRPSRSHQAEDIFGLLDLEATRKLILDPFGSIALLLLRTFYPQR